jgi:prepilin peptidase CpaA
MVQVVMLLLAIGLFAVVAYRDLRTGRIPNALTLAIGGLGVVRLVLAGDPAAALYTLAAAAALFAAAFLLLRRGLVGGGDVKLVSAAALLVGYRDLLGLLLVMSLCGALMAFAVLAAEKLAPRLRPARLPTVPPPARAERGSSARLTVPYGVAIAVAGVVTLFLQSSPPG